MDSFPAYFPRFLWHGRFTEDNAGHKWLISSGSGVKFRAYQTSCRVWIRNAAIPGEYNYISMVVDGHHYPRIPISFDTLTPLDIPFKTASEYHDVEIYKETEASCGFIVISSFEGVGEGMGDFPYSSGKKIEFIGDSFTAGMSADTSLVPCDEGRWYDQHNAYDSYGPRVARAMDLNYMISAVSGMGVYRNWNSDTPTFVDVYESTFLANQPDDPAWNFESFPADIVTILLGTNDLSEGDGITPRQPFDAAQFITRYVELIKKIHYHYPQADIVMLQVTTPEIDKRNALQKCHEEIKIKAEAEIPGLRPISLFTFSPLTLDGCGDHPSLEEHEKMANELIPVIKKLL